VISCFQICRFKLNFYHYTMVVQAVGFMLAEGLFDQITTLQALVLVVAAAAHDVVGLCTLSSTDPPTPRLIG
jgi:hypothetical protein